jgi:hypothetical protein
MAATYKRKYLYVESDAPNPEPCKQFDTWAQFMRSRRKGQDETEKYAAFPLNINITNGSKLSSFTYLNMIVYLNYICMPPTMNDVNEMIRETIELAMQQWNVYNKINSVTQMLDDVQSHDKDQKDKWYISSADNAITDRLYTLIKDRLKQEFSNDKLKTQPLPTITPSLDDIIHSHPFTDILSNRCMFKLLAKNAIAYANPRVAYVSRLLMHLKFYDRCMKHCHYDHRDIKKNIKESIPKLTKMKEDMLTKNDPSIMQDVALFINNHWPISMISQQIDTLHIDHDAIVNCSTRRIYHTYGDNWLKNITTMEEFVNRRINDLELNATLVILCIHGLQCEHLFDEGTIYANQHPTPWIYTKKTPSPNLIRKLKLQNPSNYCNPNAYSPTYNEMDLSSLPNILLSITTARHESYKLSHMASEPFSKSLEDTATSRLANTPTMQAELRRMESDRDLIHASAIITAEEKMYLVHCKSDHSFYVMDICGDENVPMFYVSSNKSGITDLLTRFLHPTGSSQYKIHILVMNDKPLANPSFMDGIMGTSKFKEYARVMCNE